MAIKNFDKADLNKDGKVTMQEQILSALGTYGRAFLAAAMALYMTGNTDPKDLVAAGFAAIAPVILKLYVYFHVVFWLIFRFPLR